MTKVKQTDKGLFFEISGDGKMESHVHGLEFKDLARCFCATLYLMMNTFSDEIKKPEPE